MSIQYNKLFGDDQLVIEEVRKSVFSDNQVVKLGMAKMI